MNLAHINCILSPSPLEKGRELSLLYWQQIFLGREGKDSGFSAFGMESMSPEREITDCRFTTPEISPWLPVGRDKFLLPFVQRVGGSKSIMLENATNKSGVRYSSISIQVAQKPKCRKNAL